VNIHISCRQTCQSQKHRQRTRQRNQLIRDPIVTTDQRVGFGSGKDGPPNPTTVTEEPPSPTSSLSQPHRQHNLNPISKDPHNLEPRRSLLNPKPKPEPKLDFSFRPEQIPQRDHRPLSSHLPTRPSSVIRACERSVRGCQMDGGSFRFSRFRACEWSSSWSWEWGRGG
jgi:hypothetical protein